MKKIHNYFNSQTPDLGNLLEYLENNNFKEINGKEQIGCGISTMIFDNGDKVIGFCIDYNKLLYLNKTKIANFKFNKFLSFEHNNEVHYVGMYEMDKLLPLSQEQLTLLEELNLSPNSDYVDKEINVKVLDIIKKSNAFVDFDVIEQINNKKYTDTCVYDFNPNQFLNDKNFDPIIVPSIINTFISKSVYSWPNWLRPLSLIFSYNYKVSVIYKLIIYIIHSFKSHIFIIF